MSHRKVCLGAVSVLLLTLATHVKSADQTLIAVGSSWRYNDTGSNLGTAWRALAYNDATWPAGLAQLGYGDGDESTVLSYGGNSSNRRITYYFRRAFTVANPASFAALTVRYVRDDGCVIYLNGVEVVRSNMPAGSVTYTTRATTAIGGADESAWLQASIDPSLLTAGNNVVAVELHQQSPTSTDISFDLELRATEAQTPAPTVSLTSPGNQSVSNTPAVTFNATVSAAAGLVNATLYVGGPRQTVVFAGPLQVEDAEISADTPTAADGSGTTINVDGLTPHAHGLVRFPTLIGAAAGQVPPGAIITSAVLQLNCTNAGNVMRLFRLTQSWNEDSATWNERSSGVPWASAGADGAGSNAGVALNGDCTAIGQRTVDVTQFVQEWSSGASNYGIVLIESGTDGVDFTSSESGTSPSLGVTYKSSQQPVDSRSLSGTTAAATFSASLPIAQTYYWNVLATDATGRQSWAPSDFELTIDATAPDAPVLVSPPNGSTGVPTSPVLTAFVSDPGGGILSVGLSLRRVAPPEFTIIALPDTQHYSELYPAIFTSQTQWIVDNKAARNIVFVTHEGDIVENYGLSSEWVRANTSMSLLDGVVPYGMGPGNHDVPTTLFNQYFPYTRYQGQPWYGGHQGNLNDNNYQLFSAGGMDFVIVHMVYCPPAAAVTWADSVFKTYPDRVGIMTTHAYLGLNAVRNTSGCGDTQYLWDSLAVPNPNLRFMLSGHVHGESRRVDIANGHPVFQMLADYQDLPNGGNGWLRILRYVPAEDKVYVQTYSPWLMSFQTDADSEFTFDFPMGGAFASAGTVTAPSGSNVAMMPAALSPNSQYEWRMTLTNASGKSRTGPVWTFTTGPGGAINQPPVAGSQSVNTQEDTPLSIALSATDQEGDPLTYSVVSGPGHGTVSGSAPALIYQPAANYNGSDSFTFRANDAHADSNLATVSIAVQAVNDAPSALSDSYSIETGQTLTVGAPGVLGNDSDIDSASMVTQLASGPANGALTLNPNGSFSYTPAAGFSGSDSFTYKASDGQLASAAATVNIAVGDTTPPVRSNAQPTGTLPAGTTQTTLSLSTNEPAVCRYATTAGTAYGAMPSTFATTGGTSHSTGVTGLASGGSYAYYVRCQDGASNANTNDSAIAFSVAVTSTNANLIAAYSFNEGLGTTLTDRSGRGHTGTISGAAWTTQGKYGSALTFDGINDWVTVNDTAALDLTTGMTLEAWVQPSSLAAWRTVLLKERSGGLAYSLYTTDTSRASSYVMIGNEAGITGPSALPLNAWTHLAATYDGATQRLFVNGVQVASRTVAGAIVASTGVLRIGGNGVWSEFFQGKIDEVRIYNRALTQAEIQSDMAVAINP